MKLWIESFWEFLTLKRWRARRRRRRYDELKALVVEQHLSARGGMVVPAKFKFDEVVQFFPPPMYSSARNERDQLLLFWRKELMNKEVGPPRPEAVKHRQEEIDAIKNQEIKKIEEGIPPRPGVEVKVGNA